MLFIENILLITKLDYIITMSIRIAYYSRNYVVAVMYVL